MQNLSAPFIFQEECRIKIEHVLFPSVFLKLRIHDQIFETSKSQILETGSCELLFLQEIRVTIFQQSFMVNVLLSTSASRTFLLVISWINYQIYVLTFSFYQLV